VFRLFATGFSVKRELSDAVKEAVSKSYGKINEKV